MDGPPRTFYGIIQPRFTQCPKEFEDSQWLGWLDVCVGLCYRGGSHCDNCGSRSKPRGRIKKDYLLFLQDFVERFESETGLKITSPVKFIKYTTEPIPQHQEYIEKYNSIFSQIYREFLNTRHVYQKSAGPEEKEDEAYFNFLRQKQEQLFFKDFGLEEKEFIKEKGLEAKLEEDREELKRYWRYL